MSILSNLVHTVNTQARHHQPSSVTGEFFLMIVIHERTTLLQTVDANGKLVQITHHGATGQVRRVLTVVDRLKERQQHAISWGQSDDGLALDEHPYLIDMMHGCPNVLLRRGRKIITPKLADETASLALHILPEADRRLQASFRLHADSESSNNFLMITDQHALAGDTLYRVSPIGQQFRLIPQFELALPPDELEEFLTLAYTTFEAINLRYGSYTTAFSEPIHTRASIFFDKVDEDKELHFRIGATIPGLDDSELTQVNLTRRVTINELEKRIVIRDVIRDDSIRCRVTIENMIKKTINSLLIQILLF